MGGFIRMFKLAELGRKLAPLSEASQMLFWELLDMADWRTGRVLTTHEEMAAKISKSVRTVERAAKELTAVGLVRHKKGMFAVNPDYAWGGRSWNMPKATYHCMNGKTAQVINFADAAQALSEETLEKIGRETLREVSARQSKGTKAC